VLREIGEGIVEAAARDYYGGLVREHWTQARPVRSSTVLDFEMELIHPGSIG
jgi:hypothetical protein